MTSTNDAAVPRCVRERGGTPMSTAMIGGGGACGHREGPNKEPLYITKICNRDVQGALIWPLLYREVPTPQPNDVENATLPRKKGGRYRTARGLLETQRLLAVSLGIMGSN